MPPASAHPDLQQLERILGDLVVEEELARTGSAVLWRVRLSGAPSAGRDGAPGEPLVLKVALEPSDSEDLARFRHEARLLSEVSHPNVVAVQEVGVLPAPGPGGGGYPFLVMEPVEPWPPGRDLVTSSGARVRLPFAAGASLGEEGVAAVYDLALQAAAGLSHIHRQGIVHLDIKPANLGFALRGEDPSAPDRLEILDFGLAQALGGPLDRKIRGTLAYAAPEILLQDRFDHRADLYSLGIALFEMVTGSLPSAGGDREALAFHLTGELPDPRTLLPDLPDPFAEILLRLTRRDPQERYPSADKLLMALAEASHRPVDPGQLALGQGAVLASRLVGREELLERLTAPLRALRGGAPGKAARGPAAPGEAGAPGGDGERRGGGRALLLEGPPGVGTSRLLREFRLLATIEGARVGLGQALPEQHRPLLPVLQALERLGTAGEGLGAVRSESRDPAGDGGSSVRERFRLYRRLAEGLARAADRAAGPPSRPLVLLVEDLHLAGRETEELLSFLAAELAGRPVLLVASRQPQLDTDRERGLAGFERIPVRPLDREATDRLVDASLGTDGPDRLPETFYGWIYDESAGFPGRVQQLLRHLVDEGALVYRDGTWKPRLSSLGRFAGTGLEGLDAQRLEALGAVRRRVLEAAAVIAEPFRLATLAALLEAPPEEAYEPLVRLVEQGFLDRFLEPDGIVYAFARRGLRTRLYEGLATDRRLDLHRALAGILEGRYRSGRTDLAAAVADHLWRGEERQRSLPYLLDAARQAVTVYGHDEAAFLYGRAVKAASEAAGGAQIGGPGEAAGGLAPDEARRTLAEARLGRARSLAAAGAPGRALQVYDTLLETVEGGDSPLGAPLGRLHLEAGRIHGRLGEHEASLARFEAGLEAGLEAGSRAGEPSPEPHIELHIELLHGKSVALRDLGEAEASFDAARSALAEAGRAGLDHQRALLLNTLAMQFFARGDWRRADRLARRGLRAAQEARRQAGGVWRPVVMLRNSLAMVQWKTADFDGAAETYRQNLETCERFNDLWGEMTALNNLGILEGSRGRWASARDLLARSLEINRRVGAREGEALARINLGEVEETLGDWPRARRHALRALELLSLEEGGVEGHPDRIAALTLLASLDRKEGNLDAALAQAAAALAAAEAGGDRDLLAQALVERALVQRALEARGGGRGGSSSAQLSAAELLERALEIVRASGTREALARLLIHLGELELERSDPEAAGAHAAEARRLLAEIDDPQETGRLRLLEAHLAALEGDTEATERGFTEAVRLFEEVDNPYELARSLYAWGLRTWNLEVARERLDKALATFERLGAEGEVGRTRGALERIRAHLRSGTARGGLAAGSVGGLSQGGGEPTLHEVVKVINTTLDLDEVLDRTMDLVLGHLGAERGMIVLQNPLTRELEVAVARNLGDEDRAEEKKLSESVVRQVIERADPVLAVDAVTDSRFASSESIIASNILSILCVPLSIRHRMAGAIYIDHRRSRHLFSKGDLEFLVAFADGAAIAIENARLYGELAEARSRLEAENTSLRREILTSHHLGSLIGKSRAIDELKKTLERVAQSSSTVLIRGESGTGKGLVARIIHNVSPRREGPFIHFNCAALPESLVESELFGHEKGAFTGAAQRKPGRFELAHGGTIFLDEIGKVSRSVQAKLLRVVEDKEFERVGGTKTLKTDVRIIAATNLHLEDAIARDEFREDLYYRLNIIPIILPPLRERRGDIPYLMEHFLQKIARDLGQARRTCEPGVRDLFESHNWPGNIRELEAAIHRGLVLSGSEVLRREDFSWIALAGGAGTGTGNGSGPEDPGLGAEARTEPADTALPPEDLWSPGPLDEGDYQETLDAFDRRLLEAALLQTGGKIRESARLLGIARNTLKAKLKRYDLDPNHFAETPAEA